MTITFNHKNYECPKCESRDLELYDTGPAPIPANDAPLTFELTAKTKCTKCGYEHELMDFASI